MGSFCFKGGPALSAGCNSAEADAMTSANNGSAFECLEHAPVLTDTAATRALILTIMAAISFVGNFLTILSIATSRNGRRRRQQSWSAVYTLILHLSVSDLLVTLFCIAGEAAWSYTVSWNAGNVACKIFKYLQMFSLYLSTFILVLIGLDRFIAVRYPIKAISAAKRCSSFVAGAWLLSFVLSIPQLSEELQKGIFFFGMSNSLVNPLIYGAFHLWRPKKTGSTRSRGQQHAYSELQRNSTAEGRRNLIGNGGRWLETASKASVNQVKSIGCQRRSTR
ncbi:receptor [Nesidiocoris tenuis]|uniref:Receptor n=1 Tax=Nesidiocoris tenuis TaxID=355587 RepID=A0ABN7ARM5_9HEMI|nr:receptor [Nesidiocoris tenuis]